MNRQLKFRIWDKLTESFIYSEDDNQQHFILDLNGNFHNLQNGSGGDEYVVQQYTGLTDSKDKEICEGDILKTPGLNDDAIGQVIYEADHGGYIFQWKWTKSKLYQSNYINLNCDVAFESVIVGNIFENPELLK